MFNRYFWLRLKGTKALRMNSVLVFRLTTLPLYSE